MRRGEYTKVTNITGTGADQVIAQANPDRIAIFFSTTGGQAWHITPQVIAAAGQGTYLANHQEQGWSDAEYPSLPASEWHGISAAASGNINVVEVIRNPS